MRLSYILQSVLWLSLALLPRMADAQAWSQNFNSGFPADWTMINDANTLSPLNPFYPTLQNKAWTTRSRSASDTCMVTTSSFDPHARADRWMVSHSFTVSSPNMYLIWDDRTPFQYVPDSLQVLVSPTAGTTAASFTSTLWNDVATKGDSFGRHAVPLGAFNGQAIRVAFRDNSYDKYYLYLDNVTAQVLPPVDAVLSHLYPITGGANAYGAPGYGKVFSANITNHGAANLTSFRVKCQVAGGAIVSTNVTANIAPYTSATFELAPYTLPSVSGSSYPVRAWVDATGDANHVNDSSATSLTAVPFMPKKKMMIEEATGTWCGWCVRGIVYMDSIWKMHPADVSAVAVHEGDPMKIDAYAGKITSVPGFYGFPSVIIDRTEVADPSDVFDLYQRRKDYFAYADISVGNITWNNNTATIPVSVKLAVNLSGDYRLVLVLTEDRVHSTASTSWDQHNYYSHKKPIGNTEYDFQQLPDPVPASKMYYDFVARYLSDSAGDAGSLPAALPANTVYNHTYTATVDPAWSRSNLHAVAMLIRHSDGQVLNSNSNRGPLGVSNVVSGINQFSVFPNPANGSATARIELSKESRIKLEIVDMTGRVVASLPAASLGAGKHLMPLPVAGIAAGLYEVRMATDAGTATALLSVVE